MAIDYLQLVVDNSGGGLHENGIRDRNPGILAGSVDQQVMALRDKPVLAPVADGLHGHAAKPRHGGGPAEGVDHAAGRLDQCLSGVGHGGNYSASLKNVKCEYPESSPGTPSSSLNPMKNTGDLTFNELVGLRIVAARKFAGRSQADVCRALEIASNKWSQWENGHYTADPRLVTRFAEVYNISMNWLYLGRTDGMAAGDSERLQIIFRGLVTERLAA